MTKRQAHTLMALAVAIFVTQILCIGLLLRGQERTRKEAEAGSDYDLSALGGLPMSAPESRE